MYDVDFGFKEKMLQFYFLHRSKVHGYLFGGIGFMVLVIAFATGGPSGVDANHAKQLFSDWQKNPTDQKLHKEMTKAVHKIPGLEVGLQAEETQVLLMHGQVDAAERLAGKCLERLRLESPMHASFAATSLLIEKGQYQKALEQAVALKEASDEKSALYACNLVRIALLQGRVGNPPGELSAWEEVKAMLEMDESSSGAQFLKANFRDKAFTLNEFISQRERALIH